MNPRVSRSSALASKATGFPIAKIAAKLAVGYRLDEVTNDITGVTPASFEPTIDYVVTKIPRWAFEKLPGASPVLEHDDAVGRRGDGDRPHVPRVAAEVPALARDRVPRAHAGPREPRRRAARRSPSIDTEELVRRSAVADTGPDLPRRRRARPRRHRSSGCTRSPGSTPGSSTRCSRSSRSSTGSAALGRPGALTRADWRRAKRLGFGDAQLADRLGRRRRTTVRAARLAAGVAVTYKTVDTCAAEFAARTPYHYGTYEDEDEVAPGTRPTVVILGSGPNRIGQGVEFDYCCVHAAFALSDAGFETVMVNCNPETVSTDYDTSDRLFFEPLTVEGVRNVCDSLAPDGR